MTGSVRTLRLALAAAVVAVSVAMPVAMPVGAVPGTCAVPGAQSKSPDGWTRINGPALSTGGDTLTTYAVDEARPERLYVTNGVTIAASRDGGCTWMESVVPDDELSPLTPLGGESGQLAQRRLIDIDVPLIAGNTVWALGHTDIVAGGTPLVRPRVLLSSDGGRTFELKNGDLPPFGRPVALHSAGLASAAFLLIDVAGEGRALYVTADSGTTWQRRRTDLPTFRDFAVDVYRGVVWAWDDARLYQSRDGGLTWGSFNLPAAPARLDVAPAFTTVSLVDGSRRDYVTPLQHIDAVGADIVTSVTAGPELGMVAQSSQVEGVSIDPPLRLRKGKRIDATPEDVTLSDLHFAQAFVDAHYVLYGFSPRALYRRLIPFDFNIPPPPKPVVTVKKVLPPPPKKPSITPAGGVITLKPGEKRKVGYDVLLPPAPTPLDVYFMTDSTGSMRDAIAAVQESVQDIVDDLSAAGIDLHFGVADFRDYPRAPADEATYPYLRRRAVGPIDDDLADALASITTGGGNGDDSALEAVYQAVTGEGRKGLTASIPAGQGAEFRRNSLKVVLVASDEVMRDPSPAEPWNAGPDKPTVIDALNREGVEFVGIRVKTSNSDARPELEEIAKGAGSVAPPGGVDCDGDDEPDIDEGKPLVCDFSSSDESIAPAFIGMLRGIKDLADVQVGVEGPRDVVKHLGDTTFAAVNVKELNTFPVPVEYACTQARYGTDTPVVLSGTLRGKTFATATATVRCLAPKKAIPIVVPPPVITREPPRPLRAAAVAPPPPPQPNPNVNPNPNPNPQAQGQGGMAHEENQQHQLALAENDLTEDEELAFSAIDNSEDVTPAVTLVLGALVACAAAGTQLHLARRTRVATNPSRGARR